MAYLPNNNRLPSTTVTSNTTMVSNESYVANHASTEIELTLPASPSQHDRVQVLNIGAAGTVAIANTGQTITFNGSTSSAGEFGGLRVSTIGSGFEVIYDGTSNWNVHLNAGSMAIAILGNILDVAVGTYTGTGASKALTGFGFTPRFFLTKRDATVPGVMTWDAMGAGYATILNSTAGPITGYITSLDSDGVTLGTGANGNASGGTYYWFAFGGTDQTGMTTGTYSGNGSSSNQITGVGFEYDMFFVARDSGSAPLFGLGSGLNNFANANKVNYCLAEADGFEVNTTDAGVNTSGTDNYYFCAIKFSPAFGENGSYTGNAADDRDITLATVEGTPILVMIAAETGNKFPYFRTSAHTGDTASGFVSIANTADIIQSFSSGTFQIGTDASVNGSSITNQYIACKA